MIFKGRIKLEPQSLIILADISSGPWAFLTLIPISRSFISSSEISIEDNVFSVMEEKFGSVLSLENGVHCEAKYSLKISALSLHLVI